MFRSCTVGLLLIVAPLAHAGETRLFILSGQSNMKHLEPAASFTPVIRKAFPDDDIIVIKDAHSGRPIRDWYLKWKPVSGVLAKGEVNGTLYKRLMGQVTPALAGKAQPVTVTFCWMQGEADTHTPDTANLYAESLRGLIAQLRDDLKRPDTFVVIGRISDFVYADYPAGCHTVREAEMAVAQADPRAGWIDTDDLNGKSNGLHYTPDGYQKLGERFAAKAIELINAKR